MTEFTYEEAVELRAKYLELQKQLPRIVSEANKSKTIVTIAKELKYNRTHIYNFLKG